MPTALTGAPWWAVLAAGTLAALSVPLTSLLRGMLRDRREGRLDDAFIEMVREIGDPEKQSQLIMQYRNQAYAIEPTGPPTPPATESAE
ncbi:hypothetical protein [Kitasatospora nipponensis]|uniref:hypothetical protein n=1 Tax=Kitasatospora nipponensis TaxID=258049 RepID=UPI0031D76D19